MNERVVNTTLDLDLKHGNIPINANFHLEEYLITI